MPTYTRRARHALCDGRVARCARRVEGAPAHAENDMDTIGDRRRGGKFAR